MAQRMPNKAEKNLMILQQKQLQVDFKLENTPYRPTQNIGTGAYGVVCSAIDARCDRKVAIKKIPNAFAAVTLVKRTLREVRILKHFRHDNIVAILDMFQARGTHGFDVYMVMDLMETDLHQIIHSKQSLTEQHLQYFLYQILRGLKYIHSAGVIHRDLKPSNLLINADCLLKIGDFGMARSLNQGPDANSPFMTQYVATRWYRAPELLFSFLDYSAAMDIWSVGCIFAEMIMRRQLFPGKDHMSQLKLIIYYLGTPSQEVMDSISSDMIKRIIMGLGQKEPLPWSTILSKATPDALDLVQRMMFMEPWKRISAEEGLQHIYLKDFHDPDTEPICSKQVVLETDSLEELTPDQLKAALAQQATKYSTFQEEQPSSTFTVALVGHPKQENNSTNSSTAKSRPLCESPDFLEGLDDETSDDQALEQPCTNTTQDDDVIMLSAKLEDTSITGNNNTEPPVEVDAKAKLRHALQAKAAAAGHAATAIGGAAGTNTTSKTDGGTIATAHSRYLEKQEKRRKRSEKQQASKPCESQRPEGGMSDEDQTLLEKWQKLQQESQQKKLEGQIGDIISQTLPSPVSSGTSERAQTYTNGPTTVSQPNNSRSGKQLDSAQLMDTWLQATNMDPEELQDLEKEIRINTPIEQM